MENINILHDVKGFYILIDGAPILSDYSRKQKTVLYCKTLQDAIVNLNEYIAYFEELQNKVNRYNFEKIRGSKRTATGDLITTPFIYPNK